MAHYVIMGAYMSYGTIGLMPSDSRWLPTVVRHVFVLNLYCSPRKAVHVLATMFERPFLPLGLNDDLVLTSHDLVDDPS